MINNSVLTILGTLLVLAQSKGVTEWCTFANKFLGGYATGTYIFPDLAAAKASCLNNDDCFGITQENAARYTLRRGATLVNSPSGETSYVPCAGYFACSQFSLKSVHGKYLSAQDDGRVEWNRPRIGGWEKITFVQFGKSTAGLKSVHGKFLAATDKNKLEWNRGGMGSWERFTLYQKEDKISLQSVHGRFLSAGDDGSVRADVAWQKSWEWFTVDPPSCLKAECDCGKGINADDYKLVKTDYDSNGGSVEAFRPEQVGYQHIQNEGGSIDQSTTFTVSEEVTETASFSHTAGASVTVGTEFEVGIPFIGSGTVSAEVSASYEFSAGTERSETKTMEAQYNCVAPAGKNVLCQALLFKYKASVPYTQTWQHKRMSCTCQSKGVFSEMTANEMRLQITED